MIEKKPKIVVGMSGGVDSSVSAALLQKEGYEVVGVFLEFWGSDSVNFDDAKKVADVLGIDLHKIDAKDRFKKEIVDWFVSEYENGRTPNPCVLCNPKMKFKVLFDAMLEFGADFVATGHYAQCLDGKLFRAKDRRKDQSYFLHGLTKKQFEKIIFPLGLYQKDEVRKLAEEFDLPIADKSESQDVCFVAEDNFGDFLKKYIKEEKGDIVDVQGNILGVHSGLPFYTIGQRRGINLGGRGPYYVIEKRMDKNQLVVTNDVEDERLTRKEIEVGDVNWIEESVEFPLDADVQIRYQSQLVHGTINLSDKKNKCVVELDEPQKFVACGQAAVFYDQDEVLGGGTII